MHIGEVELNNRDDIIFRFRKAESIIKHDELKNLEMYFCPFQEEDDAAEGLLNLFWKGDEILWDNFIAHYFVVLYRHYTYIILSDNKDRKIPEKINWKLTRNSFNMESLIQQLLNMSSIKKMKSMIMSDNHEVSSYEMMYYLHILHTSALIIIRSIDNNEIIDKLAKANQNSNIDKSEDFYKIIDWTKANEEGYFRAIDELTQKIKEKIVNNNDMEDWKKWIIFDFPNKYYKCLLEMVFPQWYLISFCTDCTSKRNWAHYADASKGVCLVYKKHKGPMGEGIRIKTCHQILIGGKSEGKKVLRNNIEHLLDVEYADFFPKFNFFEMVGNITEAMVDEWYHDKNGNTSSYYTWNRDRFQKDEWRRKYWEIFQKHITRKASVWENLKEQRVVLEDNFFTTYSKDEDRHIKYDFDELDGIIWGSRISNNEKETIRKIIQEHCEQTGRTDFNYYKAVIDEADGSIWIAKEI